MSNPSGLAHTTTSRPTKRLVQTLALSAAAAALVTSTGTQAMAVTDDGTTVANVVVESAISLTGLTPSFTLTGVPGATVAGPAAVSMNVETNNQAGYSVTVQAADDVLSPADTTANTDTIPIADLSVREAGTTTYTPLSDVTPVTVHTQGTRSADGGDTITNDYSVDIPFVNSDTYSVTLDYVASTL